MSTHYLKSAEEAIPKTEIENVNSIIRTDKEERVGILRDANEVLRIIELAVSDKEWAYSLGVSERLVRYWKAGMVPIQKKYIYDIAVKAMEAEEKAKSKFLQARQWAFTVISLHQLEQLKGAL